MQNRAGQRRRECRGLIRLFKSRLSRGVEPFAGVYGIADGENKRITEMRGMFVRLWFFEKFRFVGGVSVFDNVLIRNVFCIGIALEIREFERGLSK